MIYNCIRFIENKFCMLKVKIMIIFWKIKFGKRVTFGKNFCFRGNLKINISKDGCLVIGNNVFFNNDCSINVHKKVNIGNNNLFGEMVKIYDHNHIFNRKDSKFLKDNFTSSEIYIGDNNWFGSSVIILKNSKIENSNVIQAGTIIDCLIESNKIIKAKDILIETDIIRK